MTYKEAGVDVDAGNKAVELMKSHVKSTFQPGVLGNIGGFGGFFQLNLKDCNEPVLISGTDGVGTKLMVAFMMDKHNTVGIDCVAMCVNDVLANGAKPLFFLDYIALGKLIPEKVAEIVEGICEGCRQAGCALIGGETAEMPGLYEGDDYDLAGFTVGLVDKAKIVDGSKIKDGDVVIGLASSGLHSNGYSLARKVLFEKANLSVSDYVEELGKTLGEEILTPTKIYVKTVETLSNYDIHGMAHITGGGLIENLPRILPEGLEYKIDVNSWDIPPIFTLIQKLGEIADSEMHRTFNMGIGYVIVASQQEANSIMNTLSENGEKAWIIGKITTGKGGVVFCQS